MFLVLNVQNVWISSFIQGKGPEVGTYFGLQFIFLCFPFPNSNKPSLFFAWCCSIQGWDFSGISLLLLLGWMWVVPKKIRRCWSGPKSWAAPFLIRLLKPTKHWG